MELEELKNRLRKIEAPCKKEIWSDQKLIENQGYSPMSNQAERLRGAELDLRLSADKEYQDILGRIANLEGERIALGE